MTERTAVYRLFDAEGVLLYVGVAKDFGRRWKQHASVQSWWPAVESQTVFWLPGREDALLAEKTAIAAEGPIHNVQNSPWEKRVKDDGTGFYVVPKVKVERKRTGTWGNPRHVFRFEPGLWESFLAAVEQDPRKRKASEVVRDLVAWYSHERGAPRPERPPRR